MSVHSVASRPTGTTVPVRTAVPAAPGAGHAEAARPRAKTAVTVEHDATSGLNIVSVIDARTKEVLIQIPPESVRAVIAGLLDLASKRKASQ